MEEKTGIRLEDDISQNIKNVDVLKKISLELLQNLSSEIWSDYNIHDPGITTLEILCYVITELGYRAETNIEDVFHSENVENNSFFEAHEILSSGAISILDFKKIILDIDQVRNVDILPSSRFKENNAVYSLWIELMSPSPSEEEKKQLQGLIKELIAPKRLLATSIDQIYFLNHDLVSIDLTVEINQKLPENNLFKKIIDSVDHYFSTPANFQSIDELLNEGLSSTDIFSGPNLQNGFLSEKSLERIKIKKQLYISDLINDIMNIDEVENIKKINLVDKDGNDFNWVYKVKEHCISRLDLKNSTIKVRYQNNDLYVFNYDNSSSLLLTGKTKAAHKKNTLAIKSGNKVDLKSFRSIQYDFPGIYGVGELGARIGWSEERLAYTKQFKSFLSFFDQILANYFAQLSHLPKLFSLDNISNSIAVQWVDEIPKPYLIFKPFIENYLLKNNDYNDENKLKKEWNIWKEKNNQKLLGFLQSTIESKEVFFERRKKVLDHLLARFGYDFFTFDNLSLLDNQELINHKLALLKQLPTLGISKYYGPSIYNLELHQQSGFKSYLIHLLGLRGEDELISTSINNLTSPLKDTEGQMSLRFKNSSLSKGIEDLFNYGKSKEFYVEKDGEILLLNKSENEVFKLEFENKKSSKEIIEKLARKISLLNAKAENLYLFDHILLRPNEELHSFGFYIKIDGFNIFSSQLNLTKNQQLENEEFFINNYNNLDQYQVKEIDHHQFKVEFNCNNGKLISTKFFEDPQDAIKAVNSYIEHLDILEEKQSAIESTTKYNYIYNEVDDPFSNIITVVLPSWPSRLQNQAFKSHIIDTIIEEAPAHIFVNIKWLNYEEILLLEKSYFSYCNSVIEEVKLREEKLEKLLLLLLNNDK